MNRNLYKAGILLLGIQLILGIVFILLFYQMGNEIFTHPWYLPFSVLVQLIVLSDSIIYLKYYRFKNFESAYVVGIIVTILNMAYYFVVYNMLANGSLGNLFIPSYSVILIVTFPYVLILIKTKAGERIWLKRAGIFSLILLLFLAGSFFWGLTPYATSYAQSLTKFHQWTSLIGSLSIVFFLMNFVDELHNMGEIKLKASV